MSIGTVHLARTPLRLLVVPLAIGLVGGTVTVAGVLLGGPIGLSALTGGVILLALAGYLAAVVLSIRLEVEAGSLVLRWLGGSRRYALVRGSVTRVTVRGSTAAPLQRGFTALAWGIGAATLRGDERIELVRLAPTPTMIVVPTDHGRLAIATTADDELLAMLSTAARLQSAAPVPTLRPAEPSAAERPPPSASTAERAAAAEQPHIMTGIERALLEERLAAERAAGLAAAEAERQAAEAAGEPAPVMAEAAVVAEVPPAAPAAPVVAPSRARRRQRARWQQPAWLRLPAWMTLPPLTAQVVPIVAPLATVAVIWIAALIGGRLDAATPEARYLVLGVVLCGPVAAIGMLIARAWQPRLSGLVAFSAFAAQALLVRVLIG
jgi:hypothetical protein